jgi:hypothetical protein
MEKGIVKKRKKQTRGYGTVYRPAVTFQASIIYVDGMWAAACELEGQFFSSGHDMTPAVLAELSNERP